MKNKKNHRELSRREFLGRSAAGLATLGFSSTLLNTLWLQTGCRSGAGTGEFLLPEDVLRKAVELTMAKGADFGEVFVERGAFDVLSSDDRKINTQTTLGKGVGIRGVKDGSPRRSIRRPKPSPTRLLRGRPEEDPRSST